MTSNILIAYPCQLKEAIADTPLISSEDWVNLGKSDAWAGKPKSSPEEDVIAASMYDLGYSKGKIEHSPVINRNHQ